MHQKNSKQILFIVITCLPWQLLIPFHWEPPLLNGRVTGEKELEEPGGLEPLHHMLPRFELEANARQMMRQYATASA